MQTGKHTVTALTRSDSNGSLPEGVKPVKVNYDDEASITDALKGQEFLIITLGVQVPGDLHSRIVAAAGKAGIQYVMPNAYGYPVDHQKTGEQGYDQAVTSRVKDIEATGVSASFVLACGLWYEWSLATGEPWFGFTIKERKATFFDDGNRKITVSTWDQCGRALAALLSLRQSGVTPSLADFKNKETTVYSFRVSQRDMLDSLHRILGSSDADWDITYVTTAQRMQEGREDVKNGLFTGYVKMLYGGAFSPADRKSDFAARGSDIEILGLSEEDLDEATKRAVEMVEAGWNPFGAQ